MRETDVRHLICPACREDLIVSSVEKRQGDRLETAELACSGCQKTYPVVRFIPRFVPLENYASGFGYEWTLHAKSQYDSYCGVNVSEQRFFTETGWSRDLSGEIILEVGSGSGRFTQQAASTGATVLSLDYSYAVDANYQSNGDKENVLIVQGDVYALPFRQAYFDKVFCFGMLQHTPDVYKAFQALPPMLKAGGQLVADVYKKTFFRRYLGTKYYVRNFTINSDSEKLYAATRRWVDFVWPLSRVISKIPKIGPALNWRLLIPDYSRLGVKENILKEWAYLDIFDMLAPRYDIPQTIQTFRQWFEESKLTNINIDYGYTGIYGRGSRAIEIETEEVQKVQMAEQVSTPT